MRVTGDALFISSFVEAIRAVPNFTFVPVDSNLSNSIEARGESHFGSGAVSYMSFANSHAATLLRQGSGGQASIGSLQLTYDQNGNA